MAFVLLDWVVMALVTTGSGIVKSWTDPKPVYPEQRETAEEKWFQSRVDMGAALVKRKKIAAEMAGLVLQQHSPLFHFYRQNANFDAKMKEIRASLPANSTHANNIAILQASEMYDDFTEETKEIQTRDISKVESKIDTGEGTKQPSVVIETKKGKAGTTKPEKKRYNVLGQRLPDKEDKDKSGTFGVNMTTMEDK